MVDKVPKNLAFSLNTKPNGDSNPKMVILSKNLRQLFLLKDRLDKVKAFLDEIAEEFIDTKKVTVGIAEVTLESSSQYLSTNQDITNENMQF